MFNLVLTTQYCQGNNIGLFHNKLNVAFQRVALIIVSRKWHIETPYKHNALHHSLTDN